jgi:hypothetical protein
MGAELIRYSTLADNYSTSVDYRRLIWHVLSEVRLSLFALRYVRSFVTHCVENVNVVYLFYGLRMRNCNEMNEILRNT